jgi:stage II sporulation protein AA (anti-sigma F factor antagonist)
VTAFPDLPIDRDEAVPVVRLEGEVDISIAADLRIGLLNAVDNADLGLVIDMSDVRYIDSAGVNVLFELADALGVRRLGVALVIPEGGLVERVVALVDLGSVVHIERTTPAAIAALQRGLPPGG